MGHPLMEYSEAIDAIVPGRVKFQEVNEGKALVLSRDYDGFTWYVSFLTFEEDPEQSHKVIAKVRYQTEHSDGALAATEFGESKVRIFGRSGDQRHADVAKESYEIIRRRGPQKRRRPGKGRNPKYAQAVSLMRADLYEQTLLLIRTDKLLQQWIAEQCEVQGVECGGGNPAYGYSELIEMLVVCWMKKHELPGPWTAERSRLGDGNNVV